MPKIAGETWFNTKSLSPIDLAGNVVLVDFWTYSCVNCQRTFPFLQKWWRLYKDFKFWLVGIHTPEFDFEKDPKNVERAIREFGITWPVVLDNAYFNWENFANHYWPAKYLANKKGHIVYTHYGEGAYRETEEMIQTLIRENLGKVALPPIEEAAEGEGKVCFRPTPELYVGYERGFLGNPGGYHFDKESKYSPPPSLENDSLALAGWFLAKSQYVESIQELATLFVRFHATEVNLVLAPTGNHASVLVDFNGQPIPNEIRGLDVDSSGEVKIHYPQMYNLIKSVKPVVGTLSIRAKEGQFRAYAFTFSGCSSE